MSIVLRALVVMLWAAFDVIKRYVAYHNFLLPAKRIKSVLYREELQNQTTIILPHRLHHLLCLMCTLCNKQCVGSSVKFQTRLSKHKSHIKQKKRMCCLVNHFIDNPHDHYLSYLKLILIEQVSTKTENFLQKREGYWQAQLWTYEPYGLILEGDVNFSVKAAANYNHSPKLYELLRTNGHQKGHNQHHIMRSKSVNLRFR